MSYIGTTHFGLEVSLGKVAGYKTINKYGQTDNADSGTPTDIWNGADQAETSTIIWVPPTEARVHQLTSSDAADDSAGTGARTVKIWYLPDWDTTEASTTLIMDGTNDVATPPCVIIHRMKVLTWGTGGVNAGIITATADTDTTITAMISIACNQTQMCIYGVPSTQNLRVFQAEAHALSTGGAAVRFTGRMLEMIDPATNVVDNTAWINRENFEGTLDEHWKRDYGEVPKVFDGPCIVKFQVTANGNDKTINGTFDGIVVTT